MLEHMPGRNVPSPPIHADFAQIAFCRIAKCSPIAPTVLAMLGTRSKIVSAIKRQPASVTLRRQFPLGDARPEHDAPTTPTAHPRRLPRARRASPGPIALKFLP